MFVNNLLQFAAGQRIPSGVTTLREEGRPEKSNECLQWRHRKVRGVQSLKRMESGIWLSRGLISAVWFDEEVDELMLYFLVSRPRHSARRTASVPGMGAQRRSMGGKICL